MVRVPAVRKGMTMTFGDGDDGVIGIPALTTDGRVVETSYFYGKARPKNIVVVSSQAGCPLRCAFCELGPERFGRNLTEEEIADQAFMMLDEARLRGFDPVRVPHKITVANSGEPLLNPRLLGGLERLAGVPASFKVSTVLPAAKLASETLVRLAEFAARLDRPVQLQISLISTSEERRSAVSGGHVADFSGVRKAGEDWKARNPNGRKVNLSLIVTDDMPCDADEVVGIFPPELFRFRFREYVQTRNGIESGIKVASAARLATIKEKFAANGYEVGDWASPSPTERKFGLAANVIRRTYLDLTGGNRAK